MNSPDTGGMSKAAGELLEEMQKAQLEAQDQQQKQGVGGAAFAQTLNETQASQAIAPPAEAIDVLKAAKAHAELPSTKVGAAEGAKESKLWNVIKGIVSGQDKMTQIVNEALSGRAFGPQELLVMQAGVYRFSQELELTSKVVEKATSGVKQTMNTQV